jgi:hypothetical protein
MGSTNVAGGICGFARTQAMRGIAESIGMHDGHLNGCINRDLAAFQLGGALLHMDRSDG